MKLEKKNSGCTECERRDTLSDENDLLFDNQIVPEYVPTRFAAHYLGISENALRIKVCRGQVPVYRFGRSLRFRVSELADLLKKGEPNGN